ncbi:type ISP restriction/modification enzyme [Streptomyces sp. bgisy034]|uniref:type ISP restriction/modification enzyme n=1 Tax=Streptomyces sp. bgisy034 TaxID=3413774 RepID=UPI003EB83F1B
MPSNSAATVAPRDWSSSASTSRSTTRPWRTAPAHHPTRKPRKLNASATSWPTANSPEDFLAYIAGVVSHPAYTERFRENLEDPGVRVPLTGDVRLRDRAARIGRRVLWLHTYGDRFSDQAEGRTREMFAASLRPSSLCRGKTRHGGGNAAGPPIRARGAAPVDRLGMHRAGAAIHQGVSGLRDERTGRVSPSNLPLGETQCRDCDLPEQARSHATKGGCASVGRDTGVVVETNRAWPA